MLQVILVGQAGLRDTLRHPDLEQFAQRIAVDYHLEPLDQEETRAYIHHRLNIAGGSDQELFDDAACNAVYQHSRGVPRLINLLCDTAMVYGFAEQKNKIDAQIVNDVAEDKHKGGIFPGTGKKKTSDYLAGLDQAIIGEIESRLEHEESAGYSGSENRVTSPAITEKEIGLLNYLRNIPFKTVDVDVIKYLKHVHTELYMKLKMAVRSGQKNKNN